MAVKEQLSRIDLDKALVEIVKDETAKGRLRAEAFKQLYENHQRQVFLYFLKNVNDSETAEDLKMITFEKAHEKIESYDSAYAFSTWLYKIALNCLIDSKRKATFEVLSIESLTSFTGDEGDTLEFQIKSTCLNPEELAVKEEKEDVVKDAIMSIDNDLIRELMIERIVNDLTFTQISEKLGIPDNSTIRVNVLRGREILKEKLAILNPYK